MAFSNKNGSFKVTNSGVLDLVAAGPNGTFLWRYPSYADDAGVKLLGGVFNNDGLSDLAAVGGSGWSNRDPLVPKSGLPVLVYRP